MSVQQFLDTLSDTELAFLCAFKMSTYLPESKSAIRVELLKRNLGAAEMSSILQKVTFNPNNDGCKRCNSRKQQDNEQCKVCGWPDEAEIEKYMPRWKKALRFIGEVIGSGGLGF